MQKQVEVLVACPDCRKLYVQRVTGELVGPRKRATNSDPDLQQWCKDLGQTDGKRSWYGLMRCAACSIRLAPPILREALAKWLNHGEVKEE